MATMSQSYIVGILFLVLVFASEPASGFNLPPGVICDWPCTGGSDCIDFCLGKGFRNSGYCYGDKCCCKKNPPA
ncbi:hypothetical protein L6164_003320 [Bauhinia variegata]|uniref:Uncharacterized protein n=1 Tax=Bauhinia variegata TaxID=167791 RepID=A0ACB9Q0H2_BAUVA|nr:hypothetical protein L6164_003320 [Bauhinia variegata]